MNPSTTTIISQGTVITGDLQTAENIRIEGKILGSITARGEVIITGSGMVEGSVTGRSAVIAGTIQGDLLTTERTVLEERSTLVGNLRTRLLVVAEGALFRGQCEMQKDDAKPA